MRTPNTPTVSVVLPTYNSSSFLSAAIDSILNQTFTNFELLLLDDCSSDDTRKIIEKYAQKDNRISYIFNDKNLGIAKNRNKGIKAAKGKYIANMDHDDICDVTRLETQVQFLEKNPDYSAVGGQILIIDENADIVGKRQYPVFHQEIVKIISNISPMCNPAVLIRKSSIEQLGLYDEKLPGVEDYDMWFKMVYHGWKLQNLKNVCFKYRVTKNQQKEANLKNLLSLSQAVQRRWLVKKPFFSLKAIILHFARYLLFLVPNQLILYVFKKSYFKG